MHACMYVCMYALQDGSSHLSVDWSSGGVLPERWHLVDDPCGFWQRTKRRPARSPGKSIKYRLATRGCTLHPSPLSASLSLSLHVCVCAPVFYLPCLPAYLSIHLPSVFLPACFPLTRLFLPPHPFLPSLLLHSLSLSLSILFSLTFSPIACLLTSPVHPIPHRMPCPPSLPPTSAMASWLPVEFGLVRYSPIEGTHYFYDPVHPTAIQFLLNGHWESWDVSYVKFKARDPDVKRIAEEAEAHIVANHIPGYRQWPSEPPMVSPPNVVPPALPSPSSDNFFGSASRGQPHAYAQHHSQPTPLASPMDEHAPHISPLLDPPYQHETYTPESQTFDGSALPSLQTATAHTAANTVSVQLPGSLDDRLSQSDTRSTSRSHPETSTPILLSRNRETKVLLSLDGDGVRGLSQVLLVESLVNAICTKLGVQVEPYQIFDLIGGCSMGGVFGLMLARLRMPAQRAREAYKMVAKEVFPNKRDFFTSIDPNAPPLTHDGQSVENSVRGIVAQELGDPDAPLYDSREDATDVFVIATRIDIGTNKAALMRSFQTRRITGPEIDANMTVSEAMRSSCISPRYLQSRDSAAWRPVIEPGIVDHGTAKNNPIRDILYECRKLYRYTNDMMVIVSIGSGQGFDPTRELPEMTKSVHERSLEGGVWGEKFEADHSALMERGWMKYFRFDVPDLHDVPLEEWCHEDRIKEKTLSYLSRPDVGAMFYACVDAITAALSGVQHR
ncbi:unnamed protein product [Periconia digitata]|uniref:PNPLA domain-containing protein n=1 Tax=Periconia digitata TaxID=1303443 RepID=A0A9W4UCI6_9PLEO|nr:unnamed protein product [Periconia digitata]